MTEGIPQIQVTMLGGTGSGKTTYLIGMYAHLSAGLQRFFLTADDPDVDLDLSTAWSAMVEDGILPPPTSAEDLRVYPFTFRYGMDPLLTLDWIDYRGGAIRDRSGTGDTDAVRARLAESDSVYVTLDGALLADYLAGHGNAAVRLRDVVGRYSRTISDIADKRRDQQLIPPSLVVLITKGDLLKHVLTGDGLTRRRQLTALVRDDLFSQYFRQDWDTAVCAVTIGDIGRPTNQRVDTQAVDPAGLHKPMIFSLFSFYRHASRVFTYQADLAKQQGAERASEYQSINSGRMRRLLGRKKLAELNTEINQYGGLATSMAQLAGECQYRADILQGELLDTSMHIDGRWMGD
ncbi:hypothetical protein Nocox_40160 [Nonomuraea coxensis DSM 45129]|uniref:Uncharacterized protein n=1 Tax=Nonomuraea coxensis DSM 45129 TaxID=1122611 RepID=A0ABX8UDC7_9ACTN|nr:hypothetical protein [Nonomuraea coxensis]QYC45575.1 hypothetical protein Nocox_40160 [Nonomuraea coxensis DSM 45129]